MLTAISFLGLGNIQTTSNLNTSVRPKAENNNSQKLLPNLNKTQVDAKAMAKILVNPFENKVVLPKCTKNIKKCIPAFSKCISLFREGKVDPRVNGEIHNQYKNGELHVYTKKENGKNMVIIQHVTYVYNKNHVRIKAEDKVLGLHIPEEQYDKMIEQFSK